MSNTSAPTKQSNNNTIWQDCHLAISMIVVYFFSNCCRRMRLIINLRHLHKNSIQVVRRWNQKAWKKANTAVLNGIGYPKNRYHHFDFALHHNLLLYKPNEHVREEHTSTDVVLLTGASTIPYGDSDDIHHSARPVDFARHIVAWCVLGDVCCCVLFCLFLCVVVCCCVCCVWQGHSSSWPITDWTAESEMPVGCRQQTHSSKALSERGRTVWLERGASVRNIEI